MPASGGLLIRSTASSAVTVQNYRAIINRGAGVQLELGLDRIYQQRIELSDRLARSTVEVVVLPLQDRIISFLAAVALEAA